jgi:O-antigen/teichoic acid export membrane protein
MADQATESIGTLARGMTVNLVGSGYNVTSRLLFNVLVARLLGPQDTGVYYLALNVATLMGAIAVGGLDTTVIRYLARFRVDNDWGGFRGTLRFAMRTVGALGIGLSAVVLVGAPWIATIVFRKPEVTIPLRIVALYIPLYAFEWVLLAATQSFKQMKYKVYVEAMLNPTMRIILAFSVYMLGGRVYAILGMYVFSLFVCAVLAALSLRRCIPVNLSAYVPKVDRHEIVKYWTPLFWGNLLNFMVMYSDSFVLAHYRSTVEVGLYSVCIRLIVVMGFFLGVISQIFGPMISELHHRGEIEQLAAYAKVVTLWAVEVFAPIALIFVVASRDVLALFGKGFTVASTCLLVLVLGQFLNYVTGPVGLIINMSGWTRVQFWITAASLTLQIAMAFLLVPSMGIMGAAIANSAGVIAVNLLQVYFVWRLLHIHPFAWILAKPFVAALAGLSVALLIGRYLPLTGPLHAVVAIGGMLVTYISVLLSLGLDKHSRLAWEQFRYKMLPRFFNTPANALSGK